MSAKPVPTPLPDAVPDDCFYSPLDWEEIYECPEDAVERFIAGGPYDLSNDALNSIEWPIVLVEFKRMPKPDARWVEREAKRAVSSVIESFDEDHGDPNGDTADGTRQMVDAMKVAVQTIVDGLEVWGCEETGRSFTVTREQAKAMLEVGK